MLILFTTIGAFNIQSDFTKGTTMDDLQTNFKIENLLTTIGFSNIGSFGLGVFTFLLALKAGVSPYLSVAYGIITGVYLTAWTNLFAIMNSVAESLGDYYGMVSFFIAIIALMFGLLILKTIVDMTAAPMGGS
jgi:hypothetical protein